MAVVRCFSVLSSIALVWSWHVLGMASSGIRLAMRRLSSSNNTSLAIETPLHAGVGIHTVTIHAGGQARTLIIDTGSGDTAFPCSDCTECGQSHVHSFYHLTGEAKYVSCDENAALGLADCDECTNDVCTYGSSYVEGSYWKGRKVQDQVSFATSNLSARISFGCIDNEEGVFKNQRADGIMGMSREPDAFFLQFHAQGVIESRLFSQCLSRDGGSLVVGGVDLHLNHAPLVYTPLKENGYRYWSVSMTHLMVGHETVHASESIYNANRGCVFDTGTTFIVMPEAVKEPFERAWAAAWATTKSSHWVSQLQQYVAGQRYLLSPEQVRALPDVCFHFQNNVELCVPSTQYLQQDPMNARRYTATIFFENFAQATILGASALMNHNVVYDMDNHRIGFTRANCGSLVATTHLAFETHPRGDGFTPVVPERQAYLQVLVCAMVLISFLILSKIEYADAGLSRWIWKEQDHQLFDDPSDDRPRSDFIQHRS